jgi:hypothetical protein
VRGALLGVLIAPIAGLAAEYAVRGANGTTAVHAGLFTIGLSTAGGAVSGMVARSKLWSRVRLPSGVK